MVLTKPILVTPTPGYYFVTYDINQFTSVGAQVGAAFNGNGYVALAPPNVVDITSPTFQTSPLMAITKVVSHVTLGVNDIAQDLHAITQGETDTPFLRFNLVTDQALAPWRSLILERTGGSQDPNFPLGRNTDVEFVRIYKDIDSNDTLGPQDLNISEVNTALAVAVSSAQAVPFDMVLVSTQGFPRDNTGAMVGGNVYVNGAELMTFSGPGCQAAPTPGIDPGTGDPCIAITSRGNILGNANTPQIFSGVGAPVKKVDVFDQVNQKNVQHQVYLNNDQLLGPTAQTYFVAYDIAPSGIQNDLIGLAIRNPVWFGMPQNDVVTQNIYQNVTRVNPLGTGTTGYAFVGTNAAIAAVELSVSGFSIAPSGSSQGQQNVPLLELQLHTNVDFVNLASLRLTQLGTVITSTSPAGRGDGDLAQMSVWLDNGSLVFTPNNEMQLGFINHGSSVSAFGGGNALVNFCSTGVLPDGSCTGAPYIAITTHTTTLYIAGNIGFLDNASSSTLNDQVGVELPTFASVLGPNGLTVPAAADPGNSPPVIGRNVTISALTVPSVTMAPSSSSVMVPIIVVKCGPGTGFPAYALISPACNNGKDPTNPRNNICPNSEPGCSASDGSEPDKSKWLCNDGTKWSTSTACGSPMVDLNGDGVPDNFSIGASTIMNQVSLLGDGIPTQDITGTGILDVDVNKDGIPDMIVPNGFGGFQVLLGNDPSFPGDFAHATPVPDQGFIPSSWAGSTNKLSVTLPLINATGYYQIAAGPDYNNPTNYSHAWSSVTLSALRASALNLSGLTLHALATSTFPVTTASLPNLTLPLPNNTQLTQALTPTTTFFAVADTSKLSFPLGSGTVYVGSELIRVAIIDKTHLQCVVGTSDNGRGINGSVPIMHLPGEVVSDAGAILFAQFITTNGSGQTISTSPVRAMFMFRPDTIDPGAPAAVQPLEQGKVSYPVKWSVPNSPPSGLIAYEVQERGGIASDVSANVVWRTLNIVPSHLTTYNVGDPTFPGESPRPAGEFFSYRVRAISGAGVIGPWSTASLNVNTGATSDVIAGVSNYPNPFDSRKGGPAGQTVITYTLAAPSDVTITIYDLLGYTVKTLQFSGGTAGGQTGPNFVTWDGKNGSGAFVSKGGYIARIKVKSPLGTATAIRKIGVIH